MSVDDEEFGEQFVWNRKKNADNIRDHKVSFEEAVTAFFDPNRVLAPDEKHSQEEERFFCYAKTEQGIMTVRFTYREGRVRIFGAAYWRNGRKEYEAYHG